LISQSRGLGDVYKRQVTKIDGFSMNETEKPHCF
jgi:hypothetical protein